MDNLNSQAITSLFEGKKLSTLNQTFTALGDDTRRAILAQLLDGRIVSADNSGSIRIWDNMSGECLIQLQQNSDVACATQLTDGRLVSGGTCGLLYIWS